MKYSYCLLLIFFMACNGSENSNKLKSGSTNDSTVYAWRKITDSAPWKKTYNYQAFTIRDTLYIFHPDGVWYTTDLTAWHPSSLQDTIANQAFLDYVQWNDSIYGLGHFEGNIEQFSWKPSIYLTTDVRHWHTIAANSNLPARFFYHPFVFNNKIWIIGGEDKSTQYADIWNSADGVHWVQQKTDMPFGKRSGSQVVQLKNRLYMLDNDVWSSADGLQWQQETPAIVPDEQLVGYTALVFDHKIWLLGCNRNGSFSSEVLMSTDGKEWQKQSAPWLPRGGMAAVVFNNKIVITGGKYGGTPNHPDFRYDNDVWVMEKR